MIKHPVGRLSIRPGLGGRRQGGDGVVWGGGDGGAGGGGAGLRFDVDLGLVRTTCSSSSSATTPCIDVVCSMSA